MLKHRQQQHSIILDTDFLETWYISVLGSNGELLHLQKTSKVLSYSPLSHAEHLPLWGVGWRAVSFPPIPTADMGLSGSVNGIIGPIFIPVSYAPLPTALIIVPITASPCGVSHLGRSRSDKVAKCSLLLISRVQQSRG